MSVPLCPKCNGPMLPINGSRMHPEAPLWGCATKGCLGRRWSTAEEAYINRGTISTETTNPVELGNVALAAKQIEWDRQVAARVALVPRTDTDHEAA